jgi:hypothetical protein
VPTSRKTRTQAQGRHGIVPAARPRHKAKLNPLERYHRGRLIASMRARTKPVAWQEIANDLGLSESQCKDIHVQFMEWEAPQHDPMKAVEETIDSLTVAMHAAWENAEQAEVGSNARVYSIKTAVEVSLLRLNIMQQAGRAHRELGAPALAHQFQVLLRNLVEILDRHQVSDDLLRELMVFTEEAAGKLTAIDSSARDVSRSG